MSARERVEAQVLEVYPALVHLPTWTIDLPVRCQHLIFLSSCITLYRTVVMLELLLLQLSAKCMLQLDKFPSPGCCVGSLVLQNTGVGTCTLPVSP